MPRRGYTMMTPGEARGNWIGFVSEPRRWRNEKIISSIRRGGLLKFIVLPLPPASPGVINV